MAQLRQHKHHTPQCLTDAHCWHFTVSHAQVTETAVSHAVHCLQVLPLLDVLSTKLPKKPWWSQLLSMLPGRRRRVDQHSVYHCLLDRRLAASPHAYEWMLSDSRLAVHNLMAAQQLI